MKIKEVCKITGVQNETLKYAPTIDKVILKMKVFIGTNTIVVHNTKFHKSFLEYNSRKLGLQIHNHFIDTLQIIKKLFPDVKKYTMKTICNTLGIGDLQTNTTMNYAYAVIYIKENTLEN